MRKKIEDSLSFERDNNSRAIVNVDKNALKAYRIQRTNSKKALSANNDIENLKLDVQEIKSLLHQLINNK